MNFAKDIYQDLIDKKLWLVAVLIVAIGGGGTMQLAKAGDASVSASAPPPTTNNDDGPELSLTRASTTGFARAPRVNTKQIDPFGNSDAEYKKFLKQLKKTLNTVSGGSSDTATTGDTATTTTTTSGGGGDVTSTDTTDTGATPTDDSPTSTPKPTTPKTEKDDVISVVVTPDDDTQAKELTDVRTLSPLPDADNPFLVYVAKTADDEAQFIVASNATATGDGTCLPSVNDCSTVTLAVGQTEKFTVTSQTAAEPGATSPPSPTITHVSITLTDLSTKKVPVDDGTTDATAVAARYQARARAVGARVVSAALIDPKIATALYKNGVTFGG